MALSDEGGPSSVASEQLLELRQILLGVDQRTLEEIRTRLSDPKTRTEDIAAVLADALFVAGKDDCDALSDALKAPLAPALRASISENPEQITTAIYPVMMPAIKRAVAESMRQVMERVDSLVSQQFSMKALTWRIKAARQGVPYSELVLRETLVFRVDQVLLIQNSSGLLQQHLSAQDGAGADSDAVSGMLWAIESFMRDAFAADGEEDLSRVTLGDHVLYLVRGPESTIACAVRGVATPEFLDKVGGVLERIHGRFGRKLHDFGGEKSQLEMVRPLLRECLETEYRRSGSDKALWQNWWFKAALLGLAAYALYGGARWGVGLREVAELERISERLNQRPGLVVQGYDRAESGKWRLSGLYDPVIGDPRDYLESDTISPDDVEFRLAPYLSMDPILQLQRIRNNLGLSDQAVASLEGGVLSVTGDVTADWFQNWRDTRALPPGISRLELNGVRVMPQSALESLRSNLELPESVSAVVEGNGLILAGAASAAFVDSLKQWLAGFGNALKADSSGVSIDEPLAVEPLTRELQQASVSFDEGAVLSEGSAGTLDRVASRLTSLIALLEKSGRSVRVSVIGRSGPGGSPESNGALQLQRAKVVKDELVSRHVPASMLSVIGRSYPSDTLQQLGDRARCAEFEVMVK